MVGVIFMVVKEGGVVRLESDLWLHVGGDGCCCWMGWTRRWIFVLLGYLALGGVWSGAEAQELIGFGKDRTRGGLGGAVVRVTNLNVDGAGSLAAALRVKGRRVVVFEVGGVIDLKGRTLVISQPMVTVAGQTAPSPGITLIRGGVEIKTHDVVLQHLRVRVGSHGKKKRSGWEVDAIGLNGASRVVVDHCSVSWGTDENLSASGPRFRGKTVKDWRRRTSREVTFSHCIIAEGLANSTHSKGEHSKGTLLHDNATAIAVVGNLYASNTERNPMAKGGVQAVVVNNWISNPGRRAVHHLLKREEWGKHKSVTSRLAVVGNVVEHGADTREDVAVLENQGDSPLELFMKDNLNYDRRNKSKPLVKGEVKKMLDEPPLWPTGYKAISARKVRDWVAKEAGARPWDRDEVDERIVKQALERKGKIIDHEKEVGGYPKMKMTRKKFDVSRWNMKTLKPKKR